MSARRRRVRLLGAACDAGAGTRGASWGPRALRQAGLAERLRARGHDVVDAGDLEPPPHAELPEPAHCHQLARVVACNRAVRDAVTGALRAHELPLLLGGDHSVAFGSIAAVAAHCARTQRELRVLWLDAHADFNTPRTTPSGNLHGMVLAALCGLGPAELLEVASLRPVLQPRQVRLLGLRSVDPGERELLRRHALPVSGMDVVDAQGLAQALRGALDGVTPGTHLHLSLDADFLDPADVPGVGTPAPGGPSLEQARRGLRELAASGLVASVDVTELNPALDRDGRSAAALVELLQELFPAPAGLPAS